jgi:GTPase SAR1 family protein
MASQWGRKETIVWPPNSPIYTYGAVLLGFVLICFLMWCRFTFGSKPLQQYYTPAYIRSAVGARFGRRDKFRLLYVGDGIKAGRIASEADVVDGSTPTPEGKDLPLALSSKATADGARFLYRGPEVSLLDRPLEGYFQTFVYEGNSLFAVYSDPIYLGLGLLGFMLVGSIRKDIVRRKVLKYGRRLKGPVMLTPRQFNQSVNGQGIGFQTEQAEAMLRIPESAEAQHIQIIGDTGSGKTTLILQMLQQIEDRDESAIVYDPACEFVRRFYDEKRGDIILNPLDERCPYWGPAEELRRKAEAKAIAASLYQPTSDKKGEFFTETPQKIFAHLLTFGPTPQQLVEWMSNPDEIDKRVEGTENASILAKGAQQQRGGVLGSLGLIADSLRMLPTREEKGDNVWSATEWAEKRKGWIFITSKAAEREALRPLHSLWIDLLVLRLLNAPEPNQKKVWFVLDELASLQRLPQLHTAITENRKSRNPIILGFQGKAQLEVIYGHMAEVMLSQPATKIFLKTTEPKAAEWVSKAIGQVEIERMKETHHSGPRGGKNFTLDRQTEPLVMDSEISGLADKHAFLKLGNDVVRFSFAYTDIAAKAPDFKPRIVKDDELSFDPRTLIPKAKPIHVPANPVLVGDYPEDPEDEPERDDTTTFAPTSAKLRVDTPDALLGAASESEDRPSPVLRAPTALPPNVILFPTSGSVEPEETCSTTEQGDAISTIDTPVAGPGSPQTVTSEPTRVPTTDL